MRIQRKIHDAKMGRRQLLREQHAADFPAAGLPKRGAQPRSNVMFQFDL